MLISASVDDLDFRLKTIGITRCAELTTSLSNGGYQIDLDFSQIDRAGGLRIGAAVLAHETAHVAQHNQYGDVTSDEQRYDREYQAYRVTGWVMKGLGASYSGLPSSGNVSALKEAAKQDCIAQELQEEYENSGRGLPGVCHR